VCGTTKEAAEKLVVAGRKRPQGLKSVCENSILEGHGFSRAVNSLRASGLLAPEGIFYQRTKEFGGWKKRTSAAKAGYGNIILRHG
jgi:hypothetical protein